MTIEEWLGVSKNRQSSVDTDLVFGGLTLIDPLTLVIDRDLQAPPPEQLNSSEPVHTPQTSDDASRLWPSIIGHYNTSFRELSLNLAACLLSRPRSIDLLTIAARSRQWLYTQRPRMPSGDMVTGFSQDDHDYKLTADLPSWYPVPWTGSSRISREFPLSFGTSRFKACSSLANKPKISTDGKSLFLDACVLDTLECLVLTTPSGDWMEDHDLSRYLNVTDVTSFQNKELFTEAVVRGWLDMCSPPFHILDFILRLPPCYQPTGQKKLDALCNLFTASIWDENNVEGQTPNIGNITGFCQYLTNWVNHHVTQYAKELPTGPDPNNPLRHLVKDKEEILIKLQKSFSILKEQHPEYPWPHEAGKHSEYPWPEVGEYALESSATLAKKYGNALKQAQTGRNVFMTKMGLLVLAPDSASKGDAIMLVKGGCVPYVFTPVDNHLRKIISQYQELLNDRFHAEKYYPERTNESIQTAIEKHEQLVGRTDGWILTGEAYVEGFMHGEGIGLEFGRIRII